MKSQFELDALALDAQNYVRRLFQQFEDEWDDGLDEVENAPTERVLDQDESNESDTGLRI